MKTQIKTEDYRINELAEMRQRIAELEEENTELKRAEEELRQHRYHLEELVEERAKQLRESEEKIRNLFESVADGIVAIDLNGVYTEVNEKLLEMMGFSSKDEILGKNAFDFIAPRDIDRAIVEMQRALEQGSIARLEYTMVKTDGSEYPAEVDATVLKDASGNPVGFIASIRDITERKRAEEALRESEEKIRNLFESVTDGIFAIDLNNVYTEVNERMVEMYGVSSKDEILGKNAFEFVAPDIDRTAKVDMKRTLEQGSVATLEYIVVRTDGSEFPAEVSAKMLKDASGNPVGVIGIISDITEHKKAEESLRHSEEYYRSLIENAQDAIVIMNSDATIRYESSSMERMTGRKVKDRIGKNPFEFLHPDDTTKVMEVFLQLIENKIPITQTELRLQHKDGSWRTFEVVGNNLLDNPVVTGIVLNLHDVTERKKAEEALRESEEKLRVMFESTSEGIAVTDLKGKILEVNDTILRMSGLSREELVGQDGFALMPREDAKGIIGQGKKAIESEARTEKMSQEITPTSGREYDVDLSIGVLRDSSGDPTGFVAIVRDITERKRTEEELRKHREHLEELVEERTKELQDAQERLVRTEKLAVIGQMAGGVSHELRNPLGAIKNASYFLNMAIEQPELEVKETLEILEKEVATSERIISSLLDFARPKPATLQNVHINEVIEESLCRVTVPENVEVVRHLDETLPIILADPGQLGQVFINMILNAIQAMPEGGQLVIKSEVPGPKWVDVSFTDKGVGIPKENLAKLFEPLFTTKAKGIGLGLAICRTMVEGHGGTIEVQSTEGKGSTFIISLPVGKKEEQ